MPADQPTPVTTPETSGHGYTEDDVRWLAERLLAEYDREFDASHMSWKDFAGQAREHLDAISQRWAGRLLPADTRTEVEDEIEWRSRFGAVDTITYTDYDDAAMAVELDAARTLGSQMLSHRKRSFTYFADGSTLVGPWLPVSPNPEITDNPAGTVSGNSNPGRPDVSG